jgi:NAD(P)H-hydrate repair Nnr-like enzyme with NAD(P)H-hydrate dehydratase domain
MQDYWLKQQPDKPLYPDLLWSRPENKLQAGKLLIIGGNSQGFAAAGEAFGTASKAGIGTARVLLPVSLQKTVGRIFEVGEYAASTPSGSFSKAALAEYLDMSLWADGVLLAGDLGRNSETAILLESYLDKYPGQITVTRDVITYFGELPTVVLTRPKTLLVLSMSQLQKLGVSSRFTMAFTLSMDLLRLIENLHEFTKRYPIAIITKHHETIIVAVNGQISTTKLVNDRKVWRLHTATYASVWMLQNPSKPFEALTTAVHEATQ